MRRKIREQAPDSYWKSMVDALTTLLMVILLILMFFILNFLVENKEKYEHEYDYTGYEDYSGQHDYDITLAPTVTPGVSPQPTADPYHDVGGGGGGGGDGDSEAIPTPTPVDEAPFGEKAAVYVYLVDEETEQVIEVPDVAFELYSSNGSRVTLSTYYPEEIEYTQYETTEDGGFYLPEKIKLGEYSLRQLTEVPGYDYINDFEFEVEEPHEWNDPLIIRIPLGASKNNIQVQVNDYSTTEGLAGVTFNVVATNNIVTFDGTIRYTQGEVVDVMECDDTGYGLSDELYLGNYTLVPVELPFGHATPPQDQLVIELEKRPAGGEYAPIVTLTSRLTTVKVTVTDELITSTTLEGMTYRLSCSETGEEYEFTTNSSGFFDITNLSKNVTYRLEETGTIEHYLPSTTYWQFTVNSLGLIDNQDVFEMSLTSRMLRAEISVTDKLLGTNVSDLNIVLRRQNGEQVATWVSDGASYRIDGIEEGIYTIEVEGSDDVKTVVVENVSEIQKFSSNVITRQDKILIVVIAVILIFIIVMLCITLVPKLKEKSTQRRKAKENAADEDSDEDSDSDSNIDPASDATSASDTDTNTNTNTNTPPDTDQETK